MSLNPSDGTESLAQIQAAVRKWQIDRQASFEDMADFMSGTVNLLDQRVMLTALQGALQDIAFLLQCVYSLANPARADLLGETKP